MTPPNKLPFPFPPFKSETAKNHALARLERSERFVLKQVETIYHPSPPKLLLLLHSSILFHSFSLDFSVPPRMLPPEIAPAEKEDTRKEEEGNKAPSDALRLVLRPLPKSLPFLNCEINLKPYGSASGVWKGFPERGETTPPLSPPLPWLS